MDKVIRKQVDYKISIIKSSIKDKSDIHYFKLPYIGNFSHHIKNKLSKLCIEFCKEDFNIKLVFNSFKIKSYFSCKDPIPNDLYINLSLYINLLVLAVVLALLGKLLDILKLGLRIISKRIFLNIYTPPQHNSLCFKIIDKANSKFDVKIKEALHNWRKP